MSCGVARGSSGCTLAANHFGTVFFDGVVGAGFSEGLGDGVNVAQDGVALVFGEVAHLFGEGADVAVFYLWLWGAEQLGNFFVAHAHEGGGGIYVEPVRDFYNVLGVEGLGEATQEVVQGGVASFTPICRAVARMLPLPCLARIRARKSVTDIKSFTKLIVYPS